MNTGEIKDPHVFPFIVKGIKSSGRMEDQIKYESRRTQSEADQTSDRFKSEGYEVFVFEVKELETA